MNSGDQSFWSLAILLVLVLDVMIFMCGYYLGRKHRQKEAASAQPATSRADESLTAAMDRSLATLSDRLHTIEGRLSKVCTDPTRQPSKSPDGDRLQYAARLAKRGNSVEELMAVCNLGRGEAELIKLLHTTGETDLEPEAAVSRGVD